MTQIHNDDVSSYLSSEEIIRTSKSAETSANDMIPEPLWKKYIVNRWTRSFAIYLALLLSASAYSNWQPLFLILNNMGAYHWVCDENSTHEDDFAECDEQYDYLSQIYTVAGNMAYVIGLVAGILMDSIGGRWTMAFGVAVLYIGWIMMIYSSESVQLYWPGMIMVGCAENLLGFPGFLVGDFWPSIRDTCASLCIAMQMLSSWMPVVIWAIVEDSTVANVGQDALEYYLLICAVPSILSVIATPGNSSSITKKIKEEIAESSESAAMTTKEKLSDKNYWKSFGKLVISVDFVLFTVWYIALTLGYGFYNTMVMSHLGQDIGEYIGLLNPFRAAFGPMMGLASDWIGAFPMLVLDNVLIAMAFGISLIKTTSAGYVSATLYIIGRSFCFTTKYIFVQNFFPKEHFGKLSGIISLLGGLFGFLNAWFQVLPYSTDATFGFATGAEAVIIIIPVYLLFKHRKQQKASELTNADIAVSSIDSKTIETDDSSED